MFRMNRALLIAAALASMTGVAAKADPEDKLTIGDPAPAIQVKEFVKGVPVTGFEKGKTYVVEFWATWCAPCKITIPHLTELAREYPKVKFIGVSVWEQDQSLVKPFVKEMGDKMGYSVAMDLVPPGMKANEGQMAKTWMLAAGQTGIPAAFIVNKEGRIAWIGHPIELEKPLEKVMSGSWNMGSERAKIEKDQVRARKMLILSQKLQQASRSGDPAKVLVVIDQAVAEDPSLEPLVAFRKLSLLQRQPDKAAEYVDHLVNVTFRDDSSKLNLLSWTLVDPDKPQLAKDSKLAAAALKAAQRADEIEKGKDGAIADTLARAYWVLGDVEKALEAQERAMQYIKGTPFEKDPDIPKRLVQYRKAAGKE